MRLIDCNLRSLMALLYYIYYKESRSFQRRSNILFVLFQLIVFIAMPLSIIHSFISLKPYFEKNGILILFILIAVMSIYDYLYYFRPTKRKQIIAKFTGKYEFIDESTTLAFNLVLMLPVMISAFISVILMADKLPWQ